MKAAVCALVVVATLGKANNADNPILTPYMKIVNTIANLSDANLRDPTSPLFNPADGMWHFWVTHVNVSEGVAGYPGRVWHFYSPSLEADNWNTSGMAIDVTSEPGHFDSFGVFTPASFFDASGRDGAGEWFLLFGGVPNKTEAYGNKTEAVGLATAPSPFGPWTKSPLNPVITRGIGAWCGVPEEARVDEAEMYVIQGKPRILVKTVCTNRSALPMMLEPKADGESLFTPPFKLVSDAPVLVPPTPYGFEQARVYSGPDGRVHMFGNNHGTPRGKPHFIQHPNTSGLLGSWEFVAFLTDGQFAVGEPTPVWPKGTVPGDDPKGIPTRFIGFRGHPLQVVGMTAEWLQPPNGSEF